MASLRRFFGKSWLNNTCLDMCVDVFQVKLSQKHQVISLKSTDFILFGINEAFQNKVFQDWDMLNKKKHRKFIFYVNFFVLCFHIAIAFHSCILFTCFVCLVCRIVLFPSFILFKLLHWIVGLSVLPCTVTFFPFIVLDAFRSFSCASDTSCFLFIPLWLK